MRDEAVFITKWKTEMKHRIKLRFRDVKLSEKKIDKYLDSVIHEYMSNPEVQIINNYREQSVTTDLLSLIDTIEDNQLIIGGGGVLYVQHNTSGRENIMFDYINHQKGTRNSYKAKRKQNADDPELYAYFDILQNAAKIILNSLYGVHGYEGFILYNRFIAESVTNIGRQIITTAVMTFDSFLSNANLYNTEEELYQYITNICSEYEDDVDYTIFNIDNIDHKVIKRLIDMCAFDASDDFVSILEQMVHNMKYGEKVLLYYKNNLYEFSRVPFIMDKLRFIVESIDELKAPEKKRINDPVIIQCIDDVWDFYEKFVLYDYPVYDRVRKAMYTDRKSVLYVDTDSNFLGLAPWVKFIKEEVLRNKFNKDERDVTFIAVNVMALFLAEVIDHGLMTLARYMNVQDEYAKILNMKNEFYLSRIIFTDAKKRYVSNSVLQEGVLLNNGIGKADIKGFDFKKSVTKPYIRDIYTSICEDDILRADKIDVEKIYMKVLKLKDDINMSMMKGESTFFKQANVQIIEHYKNPYSTQGVVAVLLWNSLNPTYAMELPTDCDIVPIKELTGPKLENGKVRWANESFIMEFKEKYPDAYSRLERDIYHNSNQLIRLMGLTSIAKPKNSEIPLPDWFDFLLDTEKVVQDSLNLISPILKSLGLNGLKTNASTEYMTNIIDL